MTVAERGEQRRARTAAAHAGRRRRRIAELDRQLKLVSEWHRHGWDVNEENVRACIERGLPPIAGGAQGLNPAVFMNSTPAEGSYRIDQQTFDRMTERNDLFEPVDVWPGFGGRIDHRLKNVGVIANIRLFVTLSVTVSGSGTVTSLYPFPYNLIRKVTLNANGAAQTWQCQGLDARARFLRLFHNPADVLGLNTAPGMDTTATATAAAPYRPIGKQFPGTIANGTYNVNFVLDITPAYDPRSLIGALFAQSDQTYLNFIIETAQSGDTLSIGTGSSVAFNAGSQVQAEVTFFSIPRMNTEGGGSVIILPAGVRWLHEFIASDFYFSNNQDVIVPLVRSNGQLRCLYHYIDNGGAAQILPMSLSTIKWMYAGNVVPRNYLAGHLMSENQRNYDGPIDPGYMLIDFEQANVRRDVVYPRGLAELDVDFFVPTSITPNANAHVHTVQETLTTV
ncbi:MAG TPA: hypothetical protein VG348_15880 [Acidimicrobiia bacterium]|jgi:hypothetical protein|nr:hypothetical protein [Acidimicrobiia bacterium]